jgi:hypothetical protein
MKPTRVYLSVFELDTALVAGDPRYRVISSTDAPLFTVAPVAVPAARPAAVPQVALAVASLFRRHSIDHVWFRDLWDYPTIEDTIANCTALLAVVDQYYFSSTGKAIELTYAAGQLAHARSPIPPIPIFVLPLDDSYTRYRHLEGPGRWTFIEPNAEHAVERMLVRR